VSSNCDPLFGNRLGAAWRINPWCLYGYLFDHSDQPCDSFKTL
jgi:hypothetical protein